MQGWLVVLLCSHFKRKIGDYIIGISPFHHLPLTKDIYIAYVKQNLLIEGSGEKFYYGTITIKLAIFVYCLNCFCILSGNFFIESAREKLDIDVLKRGFFSDVNYS